MTKRIAALAAVAFAILAIGAPHVPCEAADAAEPSKSAKVTYVSGRTAYLDAGEDEGLAVGDLVDLIRDGIPSGRLKVTYVASHRASCEPVDADTQVAVGDVVRYRPHAKAAPAPTATGVAATGSAAATPGAAPAAPAAPPASPARKVPTVSAFTRAGLRGRIGVRYLWVKDRTGLGEDLAQPALDLLLRGAQVGGAPVDLDVDVRARRTYRTPSGGDRVDESRNRIYTANVAWRPDGFRFVFGRQVSPTLAVTSLYDGITAAWVGNRAEAGILAGTQPDPVTYSYSGDVRQYGAYARFGAAPSSSVRWNVGFGLISSTENGEINRDFTYVEARVIARAFSLYAQEQVDVNRGWRKDAEGSTFTPSGTFVMVHGRPSASWSVDAGYDSRRNVRVYRDLVTPVTDFDDVTRQGYWAGLAWRPKGKWLVGLNGRRTTGGTVGPANSGTLRLGMTNLTSHAVGVELRATTYDGPFLTGKLAEVSASADLVSRVRAEVHAGTRRDNPASPLAPQATINWYGTLLDVLAGRSVYVNVSYDRTSGGEEDNDQVYAALAWRF